MKLLLAMLVATAGPAQNPRAMSVKLFTLGLAL